jgi:Response regulator of the LytR/AlgR family
MKIKLIVDVNVEETITITCNEYTPQIKKVHTLLQQLENTQKNVIGYHEDMEYYLELRTISFFETMNEVVYAHTRDKMYIIKQRLYELEKSLPNEFMRISKSTILNLGHLSAIETSLGGPRQIFLQKSNKAVFVSRKYYPVLKERLKERL